MRDHAKVFFKFFRICAIFGFVFAWAFLPLTDYLTIRIGGVRVSLSPKIEQAYAAYPAVASYEEGTSGGSTSNSLTLTKPSGVQAGDLLIIIVGNDDDSNFAQWDNTDLKPSGFTLINESGSADPDCHTAAFYRIADGSEGDTISVPAQSSDEYYGWYIRVTGADTNNPINAVGSDVNTSSATSEVDITGVTTTVAETLVFYTACFDGADGEPFTVTGTDWSKSDEAVSGTSGTQASGSWGTKQQATAGSTGTVNIDATGSTSDGWSGFQFAVAPFAGQPITVSGTLYSDQGLSAIDCSASSHTVRVLVNGSGSYTGTCTEDTGAYSVSNVGVSSPGDVITVFIDGHTTNKGTVVTRIADTESEIIADIYKDTVIVRHEDEGPITNSDLSLYDSSNDDDIQFSVSNGNLTVASGIDLLIWSDKIYSPGGGINIEGDLIVDGSLTGNTNATVKGDVIGDGVIDVAGELVWTQATNSADWGPRVGHTSVVFDNKIWVIGGEDQNGTTNDVWYSTNGTTWTQATDDADWSARIGHSSVVFDNKMWVIGGGTNDIWYSEDGINWTQATNSADWGPRAAHTSVVFDNKIWVLGGLGLTGPANDVWYSEDGINWTQATNSADWGPRMGHTSVVFDNKIWVLGGINEPAQIIYNDIWYSTDGANWTQATDDAPWDARSANSAVVFDNKIWVLGGINEPAQIIYNDIWYSTDGANWTQATDDAPWDERYFQTAVTFNNKIWIAGGTDGLILFNDVWTFGGDVFTVKGSGVFGSDSNWFFDDLILSWDENQSDWYSNAWSNRKKITIDHTQVSGSEDLIDFPVLINLSSDTDLASGAQDDGDDILFTSSDGVTKLSHEIEKFDGNTGELVAWVKIPILSYDTDTEIYMYYGNGSAANQEDAENVWSNGYGAVWHFYDDGNGSLSALDSTSNNNDGMVNGADFMDAGFGGSAYFNVNDSSDHVLVSHDNSISNLNSMTVSARVILASYGANNAGRIFDKNTSERDYLFFVTGDGFVWGANRWTSNRGEWKANSTISLGEWHYLTVTYDYTSTSNEPSIYLDGTLVTNVSKLQTPSGQLSTSTDDLYIGNTSDGGRSFNGLIDELRILNRELSADWIATEYNNLSESDEFYTVGEEEDQSDWYSETWLRRKKITIDHTQVSGSEDLIDFPVLINLSSDTDLASGAQDDGDDILFTSSDGVTKLSHEIEKFDGNTGELVAWVKIPILSYDTDTEIYMYYGNGSASSQQDKTNVWSSYYAGVWHLGDGESTSSNFYKDSSGNNRHGTLTDAEGDSSQGVGKVGEAVDFSGNADYITLVDYDIASGGYTFSAWVKPSSSSSNNMRILSKYSASNNQIWSMLDSGGGLNAGLHDGTDWREVDGATNLRDGQWHYISIRITTTAIEGYEDGVLIGSTNHDNSFPTNNDSWHIGSIDGTDEFFEGLIDEVRISSNQLTADWIATEYNNQNSPSDFYSLGSEQEFVEKEIVITETTSMGSGSISAVSLKIGTNHFLDMDSRSWILTGNGTSLVVDGSVNTATSGITFETSDTLGTTIPALTYYNLTFNGPGNTFTVAPGTFKTNNNLTVTDGILDLDTNDPTTTVTGDAVISGTLLASDSSAFTIKGDLTMNGDFVHNNGTVVLDPIDSSATVSGTADNITFYNLTSTTRSKTLQFRAYNNSGDEISIEGNLIITGQDGYPIMVRSDSPGTQWKINFSGSSNINYALLRDCGCDVGSGSIFLGQNVYNSGNNGGCWLIIQRSTGSVSISPDSGGGGTPQTGGGQGEGSGSTEDGSGGGTPETGGTPGGGGGTPSP